MGHYLEDYRDNLWTRCCNTHEQIEGDLGKEDEDALSFVLDLVDRLVHPEDEQVPDITHVQLLDIIRKEGRFNHERESYSQALAKEYWQLYELLPQEIHDQLNKPFEVQSVCRIDVMSEALSHGLTLEQVLTLDDAEMERIAEDMGDSCAEGGSYWDSLDTAILLRKEDGTIVTS